MGIVQFNLSAAPRISLDEAKKKLDEGADVVFIDTRSEAEYEKAHIPGAIQMSLREIPLRMAEIPRGKEVITY